jgi:hypothetical protein
MKSWYSEDPFPGWINKLTANKPQFAAFLTQQYNLEAGIDISYKRSASKEPGKEQAGAVDFPESVDMT